MLAVEDDPADVELILHTLQRGGFDVRLDVAETPEIFSRQLESNVYDVILADYNLPCWNGMDTLELVRKRGWTSPWCSSPGH